MGGKPVAANANSGEESIKAAAIEKTEQPKSERPAGKPGGRPGGGPGGRPPKKFLGKTSEKIGFVLGIVALLVLWFCPPVWGLEPVGMHMLGIFALCLIFWIFNPIPAELTGLLLMILPVLTKTVSLQVGFSGFQASTTWFIFGGLIIGRLIQTSGLDRRITLNIVRIFGGKNLSLWKVIFCVIILSFVLTLVVPSGTVLALLLGAQIYPLVKLYGVDEKSTVAKMLMVTIPVFVLLCGNESLSGSSHNLVLLGCLEKGGISISWLGWFLAILPDTIIVTVFVLIFFKLYFKPEVLTVPGGQEKIKEELVALGKFSVDEKKSLVFFLVALVLWVTNSLTGIHVAHTALGVALLALFPGIGCLEFRSTLKNINWAMILFVAAVLGIGSMMAAVGLEDAFTNFFNAISPYFGGWLGFTVLLWLLAQITAWLGLAIGSPMLFVPFMFPIASGMGMPPVYAALMQGYMQPTVMYYHAPAPMVVADYGCYTQGDYIKTQLVVCLGKIVATPLLVWCWWPLLGSIGIL